MKFVLRLFLLILPILLHSQNTNFWKKTQINDIPQKNIINYSSKTVSPVYYELDKISLTEFISNAPDRFSRAKSQVILDIPNSKGGIDKFEVFSTQTMAPELSAKYSNIKSYVGRNILDNNHRLRITVTPYGFYAMTLGSKYGQTYINPFTKNSNAYIVFNKEQVEGTAEKFVCELENKKSLDTQITPEPLSLIDDNILRKYRLGIATTVEYSQFHWSNAGISSGASDQVKKNAVQSAIVVSIDRVNEIYERDLGVTFELIPNNEDVIYLGSPNSDPYSNNSGFSMLNQNQNVFNSVIGSANYDVGHVYSTGGGGIASLGSVCSSSKARGVTGQPSPVGDPFDIDYVAHELGHQFGANHTQNNNCNRNNSTAVEPGSASTIMGYAGICSPNLQSNSDAMFHYISIVEIANFIQNNGGSSCFENINISNNEPQLQNVPNYIIPRNTPFALTVSATDANGDDLTYSWEQFDNDIAPMPPQSNSNQGPNFRAFLPSDSPTRFFPGMNTLLNNNYSNTWEVLPNVNRTMEFAVVVRDNNIAGGQVSTETTLLSVNASAGPFRVTSQQGSNVTWAANSNKIISWNVANTDNPSGVNSQVVDIVLSLDNGQNFDQILISNTPNDGSETITVPNTIAQNARLMVKSADNIFFDINQANIEITNSGVVCNAPTNLNTAEVTSTTAEFNWTAANPLPSDGYEWVVVGSGVSPDSSNNADAGTVASGVSSASANGLNPDTTYDIYVRSLCGDDNLSEWSASESFTTLPENNETCLPPTDLNVTDVSTTTVDFSWSISASLPSDGYEWVVVGSGVSPDSSNNADAGAVASGVSSASANGLNPDTTYDIYVRSLCGGNDTSEWSNVESFTTSPVASSCLPPSDLSTNNITTTTVEINWTESQSFPSSGYQWGIVNAGVAPAISNLLVSGASSLGELTAIVQGLDPNTSYDFYIRSRCGGGDLSNLSSISFTTQSENNETCLEPTNLNVTDVSTTAVDFSWTASGSSPSDGYEWVVVGSGVSPDASSTADSGIIGSGVLSASANGLNPDTNYDIYVRSLCGGDDISGWSSVESFQTTSAASSCLPPSDLSANNITSTSATINWTESQSFPSNGYQWGVVSAGDAPVPSNLIVSGTSSVGDLSVNVQGLDQNTSYDFYIRSRCNGGDLSNLVSISFTTLPENSDASYCDAAGDGANDSNQFEKIDNVIFNTINNSSTSNAGYQDFTAISTAVQKGSNYSITVESPDVSFQQNQVRVWIDFNQDFDFDDFGEEVFVSSTGFSPWSGNINIPQTALIGETTMRIRLHDTQFGPNNSPCGNSNYGEVEDYSINITNNRSGSNYDDPLTRLENFGDDFILFPNPTSNGLFNIKTSNISGKEVDVKIQNILGQQVFSQKYKVGQNGEVNIDATSLSAGVYTVTLGQGNQLFVSKLIVK